MTTLPLPPRCFSDPREPFEAVFREYAPLCLATARAVLHDGQLAEDAVQEAFVDHWSHPGRYDPTKASLGGWLVMLTHRKAVDRVRHERRRQTLVLVETDDADGAVVDPCRQALVGVEFARAQKVLAALPWAQREALVLAYWGGHSQVEIARITQAPLGTVKTRMRRGLHQLAQALGSDQDDQDDQDARHARPAVG